MIKHKQFINFDYSVDEWPFFKKAIIKLNTANMLRACQYCLHDLMPIAIGRVQDNITECLCYIDKAFRDPENTDRDEGDIIANRVLENVDDEISHAVASVAYACNAFLIHYVGDITHHICADRTDWAFKWACAAWKKINGFNKLNEYAVIINSFFSESTTKLPNFGFQGRILYMIDELEENIIIQNRRKNRFYLNMNKMHLCPEYGFSSQSDLLEKLFDHRHSDVFFWKYARYWLNRITS